MPETLKELLSYEPETGIFRWKVARTNSNKVGDIAGYSEGRYWKIGIGKTKHYAHRLAWAMVYGEMPKQHIDHINGDKLDNRIANLRLADKSQNGANRGKQKDNTSGFKGVYWHKQNQGYAAEIRIKNKKHYLGIFDTAIAAHFAYRLAAVQCFGEFAHYG
jgi:hypothetical protein